MMNYKFLSSHNHRIISLSISTFPLNVSYLNCYDTNNLEACNRSFSSSLPSFGALKNLCIIDSYVEYDNDGYEIEYSIDESEREYYVARYELVKAYSASIKNSDLTSKVYPFNPHYFNISMGRDGNKYVKIHSKTGISTKLGINRWVSLNIKVKNISLDLFKPNILFLQKYLCEPSSMSHLLIEGYYFWDFHSDVYINKLRCFKQNNFIKNKNYFVFLVNTPDILISSCVRDLITLYYHKICDRPRSAYYSMHKKKHEFNYELLSLYHDLGHELVINYIKFMYTKYLKDNNIKIYYGRLNFKDPIIITDKKDFLSYVEFKKKLVLDEQYYMDTSDFVEYGRDMYLFMIFYTYLAKSSELKAKDLKKTRFSKKSIKPSTSKELIINDNISHNSFDIYQEMKENLGHFYPSRSRIKQLINRSKRITISAYNKKSDPKYYYHAYSKSCSPTYLHSRRGACYITTKVENMLAINNYNSFISLRERHLLRSGGGHCDLLGSLNKPSKSVIYFYTSRGIFSNFCRHSTYLNNFNISYNKPVFYSTSRTDSEKPVKLDLYLPEIKKILYENKFDVNLAQLKIEEKWLDIAKDIFNIESSIHKNNKTIFLKAFEILSLYISKGYVKRSFKDIKDFLNDEKHVIITFSYIIYYYSKVGETNITVTIGRNIAFNIYKEHFVKNKLYNSFKSFTEDFNMDTIYFLKLGNIFIELFTTQLNPVFVRIFYEDQYILRINKDYESELRNNMVIIPQSLPMVAKPLKWGEGEYGGFLLNRDPDYQDGLVTGSIHHSHNITLNKKIYDVVNYLNSLQFTINSDLLNYLDNEGSFLLEYYRETDYKNYINNCIILDIARTYKTTPFYLNVNLDWRGRIYTKSFYIDYQGSEFSLAFISLSKGEILSNEGKYYLYIYGANIFNDNNISKKPFHERYDWVINNLENIYSMDKNFILKAESPTLFAAFCLNMKQLKRNPSYLIKFPVFLDATCSGVQHFAAMLLDQNLAENVNLINSKNKDVVKDFYSTLVPHINDAINNAWKTDVKANNFKNIKLTRKELKSIIMTKAYNVTTYGINEQLKSNLNKIPKKIVSKGKEITVYDYIVPASNKEGFIILDVYETEKMGDIISENIFNKYPSLHNIYKYLMNMSKILVKLNIPITWSTPAGLELMQRYNLSDTQKVTINILGKNKTAVLRKWNNNNDTRTEVQAIIPNIIHSMDASHLIEVILEWSTKSKYILSIHDCFGTHPNDMHNLTNLVRETFIKLYVTGDFLEKINNKFMTNIEDYKVPIVEWKGKRCVQITNKRKRNEYFELPILPEKGDLDINKINGKYFIS